MKKTMRQRISRATASNYKLNKKALQIKRSWDEVQGIINGSQKRKKGRKDL